VPGLKFEYLSDKDIDKDKYKEGISETMLCATVPGKDSCQVGNCFDIWIFVSI